MERQELDVRSLSQALRRSWVTIVLCLLAGVLLGVALSAITPTRYQTSSSVILRRAGSNGNTPEGEMATEVAIAHSVPVASRVQLALDIKEPVELFLKTYTAIARTDDVLVFQATASSADGSVAVANTLAEQFLTFRREQDDEEVDVLRRSLSGRVAQLESDIAELDRQIADGEGNAPVVPGVTDTATARLVDTRQTMVEELGSIQGTISTAELEATIAGEGSKIIERASPPSDPTQPNTRFNLILGILGGLALGVGIVVVRELTSGKLRNRQDIAAAAGAPVLRSIRLPGRRALPARGARLARVWKKPGVSFERGVHAIAAEIGLGKTTDAVVVASVDSDGEAALLVLRLAQDLMVAGRKPLVADVSDGASTLQGVLVSTGLLRESSDEGEAPRKWFLPTEADATSGSWTGLNTGSLKVMPGRARRWTVSSKSSVLADADLLIVYSRDWFGGDEPPTLDVAGLALLPGLLVVGSGRTSGETIRRHAEALDQLSAEPAGVIVLQPDRFDETTGQLDAPPASGATPLRSRAVES